MKISREKALEISEAINADLCRYCGMPVISDQEDPADWVHEHDGLYTCVFKTDDIRTIAAPSEGAAQVTERP